MSVRHSGTRILSTVSIHPFSSRHNIQQVRSSHRPHPPCPLSSSHQRSKTRPDQTRPDQTMTAITRNATHYFPFMPSSMPFHHLPHVKQHRVPWNERKKRMLSSSLNFCYANARIAARGVCEATLIVVVKVFPPRDDVIKCRFMYIVG